MRLRGNDDGASLWTVSMIGIMVRTRTGRFVMPWCVTVDDADVEHDVAFGWTYRQATRRCLLRHAARVAREAAG